MKGKEFTTIHNFHIFSYVNFEIAVFCITTSTNVLSLMHQKEGINMTIWWNIPVNYSFFGKLFSHLSTKKEAILRRASFSFEWGSIQPSRTKKFKWNFFFCFYNKSILWVEWSVNLFEEKLAEVKLETVKTFLADILGSLKIKCIFKINLE